MEYQVGDLPPTKRTVLLPPEGVEREQVWVVDVAWKTTNPIHRAILHVGFVEKKDTAFPFRGYCDIWSKSYEEATNVGQAHYLKLVRKIEENIHA